MGKRFKFKLKLNLSRFKLCQPKDIVTSFTTPLIPVTTIRNSLFNKKALDVNWPRLPAPPPCSPEQAVSKRHAVSSKTASVGRRSSILSRSALVDLSDETCSPELLEFAITRRDGYCKIGKGEDKTDKKKEGSIYSLVGEETKTLLSSSSLCYDSSCDFSVQYMESEMENDMYDDPSKRHKTTSQLMAKRLVVSPETPPSTEVAVDGRMKESVAIVKKWEDPYEDFKRSMMEMIVEKQILEAKGLEELLRSFLSLNSRRYHSVIVQAFTDIWDALFCSDDSFFQ